MRSVTTSVRVAMATISSDERILQVTGGLNAGDDGFLTVVEMAETSDFSLLVELVASELHLSHYLHVLVEFEQLLGSRSARRRQLVSFKSVGKVAVERDGDRGESEER